MEIYTNRFFMFTKAIKEIFDKTKCGVLKDCQVYILDYKTMKGYGLW